MTHPPPSPTQQVTLRKYFPCGPCHPRMVVRVELKQCFFSRTLFEDVCGRQGQSHKDQGCLAAGRDHFDKDHHGASSLWVPAGAGAFPLRSSQTLLDLARRRATVGCQGAAPVGRSSLRAAAAMSYHFPGVKKKKKRKKSKIFRIRETFIPAHGSLQVAWSPGCSRGGDPVGDV